MVGSVAGQGRPPTLWQGRGFLRHPALLGKSTPQQDFDLRVDAAQFVVRPALQCVVHCWVDAQQDLFAFGHEYNEPALTMGEAG